MQCHIIIRTGIKEATQREEIVGSGSIEGLLNVKYVEKKVIMPQTVRTDTQNLMQTLLKHLQPTVDPSISSNVLARCPAMY